MYANTTNIPTTSEVIQLLYILGGIQLFATSSIPKYTRTSQASHEQEDLARHMAKNFSFFDTVSDSYFEMLISKA